MDELTLVRPRSTQWGFVFVDLSFAERTDHREICGRYDLHENIGEREFHHLTLEIKWLLTQNKNRGWFIFCSEAGSVS